MQILALIAGYVVVAFVGSLAFIILLRILQGRIDLSMLVSEKDGPASLSRFQFLVFTFVVSVCTVVLTLESGEFPRLSEDILALLGISGGSYLVSKGIQASGKSAAAAKTKESAASPLNLPE